MESGIVGYSTITLKPGYNMIAVNFENLADDEGISIQDLFPGTTEGLVAGTASTGDEIQIYDPETSGYTKFYLQYVTYPLPAMANNYKWIENGVASNHKFKPGDTFWYRHRGEEGTDGVTITVAGGVTAEAKQSIEIKTGYNMIGSIIPANFNPNSLGVDYWQTCGATAGTASAGDEIQIYDPETKGYTKYYLQYVTSPLPAMANNYKWILDGTPVAEDAEVLPPSAGAWYRHRGTGFTLEIPTNVGE